MLCQLCYFSCWHDFAEDNLELHWPPWKSYIFPKLVPVRPLPSHCVCTHFLLLPSSIFPPVLLNTFICPPSHHYLFLPSVHLPDFSHFNPSAPCCHLNLNSPYPPSGALRWLRTSESNHLRLKIETTPPIWKQKLVFFLLRCALEIFRQLLDNSSVTALRLSPWPPSDCTSGQKEVLEVFTNVGSQVTLTCPICWKFKLGKDIKWR